MIEHAPAPAVGGHKFEIGMRLGVALPMGSFNGDGTTSSGETYVNIPMSDFIAVKIPVLFEAGYEITPHILLGLHAQYGFISDKSSEKACPSGFTCSDHDVEIGLDAQFHFAGFGMPLDPWLGLGVGYEFESYSTTSSGFNSFSDEGKYKGPQYLKLQGGADFSVANFFTVGPFLSFSVAEYTSTTDNGVTQDIPFTAMHEWLSLGVKGTFRVGQD